jgi:RNA polymerase sigma-70 factor, ECF subfamily
MIGLAEFDTEQLVAQASAGDLAAREQLLVRHRARLRQMIASRLDRRLAARVDPSDVVQEALAEAAGKLSDYLRFRPLPFYPWLRQLAWQRLVDLHRRHVRAKSRSVTREEGQALPLADESAVQLADRLLAREMGPMSLLLQAELHCRVRRVLETLPDHDREVLVLRHLEQLSTKEMAAVLEISESAVKMRHVRALERFRDELDRQNREEES